MYGTPNSSLWLLKNRQTLISINTVQILQRHAWNLINGRLPSICIYAAAGLSRVPKSTLILIIL
jgi:hypothetical protein